MSHIHSTEMIRLNLIQISNADFKLIIIKNLTASSIALTWNYSYQHALSHYV